VTNRETCSKVFLSQKRAHSRGEGRKCIKSARLIETERYLIVGDNVSILIVDRNVSNEMHVAHLSSWRYLFSRTRQISCRLNTNPIIIH